MTPAFVPVIVHPPLAPAVPLVLDSPHASTHLPADFGPLAVLAGYAQRRAEST